MPIRNAWETFFCLRSNLSIAGGVLAAYIEFGVSASHLLSASVMSAPAALAISKLMYPETEMPETLNEDEIDLPKGLVF